MVKVGSKMTDEKYGFSENEAASSEAPVDYSIARGASTRINGKSDPSSDSSRTDGSYSSIYSDVEGGGYGGFDASGSRKTNSGYDSGRTYGTFSGPGNTAAGNKQTDVKTGRKKGKVMKKAGVYLLIIILCFGAGFAGSRLGNKGPADTPSSGGSSVSSGNVNITGDLESLDAASAIAEKEMPAVVGISTVSQTLTETIFGLQSGQSTGIGTGIVVSDDGYVLTNSHVVNDGNTETITVDLYDGSEYEGTILWNDSSLDLAIVKIEANGLSTAVLGDSSTVKIGDYAMAIGNPMGLDYERSVTSGIISGLNRSITVGSNDGNVNVMDGLIQTDASINSGNSGGPLINSSGEVIGINSAKASSAEGLGFAIPINVVIPVIDAVKEKGSFESAYIGISGIDLANINSQRGDKFVAEAGVYVYQVVEGTGAANAGMKSGDIITAVNGVEVDSMNSLKKELIHYAPGDTIEITFERNKTSSTISVVLGSASDSVPQNEEQNRSEENAQPDMGNNSQEGPYNNNGGLGDLFNNFFRNW